MVERFLLGQTVELETELRDGESDAQLAMAAAVLKVKRPSAADFTAVTTTLSPDSLRATAQVPIDEVGEWLTRWEVSGPPDAVQLDRFQADPDQRLPAAAKTVAVRGERGAKGDPGNAGPRGDPGPPGEQPMDEDMPSSGTWTRGQVVWAKTRVIDVAGRRILGWQRETDGSGHVAGVDWTTLYADVASGPGYVLTEAGERLVSEAQERLTQEGGGLEPKKISQLPETFDFYGAAVAASKGGTTRRFDVASTMMTYVIPNVGVPIADYIHGTTVLPDDTVKVNAGIAQARALGFTRVGTRGVVVLVNGVVQFFKAMALSSGTGVDVQDAISGASGYHAVPHWQFGPDAKIVGAGGAMRTEDFLAISTAWAPVAPGSDPVLDDRAQRDAMTHQIRGYAGACLEWEGDGNAIIRSALLGFIRPWDFTRGGRHHWDSIIIDVGGTMEQYGVGFRLTRSGGAPRGRAAHVVTLGIKNVTGVNALDHVILAASEVTSGTHTGKTRITIGVCYHLKYKLWVAAQQVSKGDERVVNYSGDPLNVSLHLFEVKKRGDWVTGTVAPGTGTTLTEAEIGATFSDGAVDWVYRGPYTGVRFEADRPAAYLLAKDTNPAGAWGHRVIVNVDPAVLYDEADLDPRVRGHYEVLAAGTQAADEAQWILDLPWQAHFAAALPAGGFMSVYPGMRIAKSIEAQGDGLYLDGWTNKACLVAGDIEASNGTGIDLSEEESSEGENSVDNKHSLGYRFGPKSAGMVLLGGGHKNLGYCMVVDTGQDQPVEYVAKESSGGVNAGIWVKSGAVRVSGGHIRGFAMRIRVDDDGFADLSGLTTAPGLEIIGEGWENRVIMPRVGVTGPALGRQVIAGPGRIEIGETAAITPWAPLTAVTVGLRWRVRGIQGDLWRLRCTTAGTTAATAPAVMREKKQRENATAYVLGKDLWLVGGDGNAHLVQVASVTGAGLSGGSPPAVTDATVTIADGNLTLRRLGRYTGPGAVVPDGTAVWAIEDIDLGVRGRITYDPGTGRGELASFTGGGVRNVRVAWSEDHGCEVDSLYHVASARDVISSRGDLRPRRRTISQITTNDADPAAGNLSRLVIATDAVGGEALAHATDNGPPAIYMRVPPGPFADDAAAQAGGVVSRGFYEDTAGVIRRRTT